MAFDHEETEPYYVSHDAGRWTVVRRSSKVILSRHDTYYDALAACGNLTAMANDGRQAGDNLTDTLKQDGDTRGPAEFVTKDSGERAEFPTGMVRDTDDGKPRFDLLFPAEMPYDKQILTRWAQLMERGAKKYDARNWEKAETQEELNRFKASALRHFMQWYNEETDEDHASAVMFNIMGAEYVEWRLSMRRLFQEDDS